MILRLWLFSNLGQTNDLSTNLDAFILKNHYDRLQFIYDDHIHKFIGFLIMLIGIQSSLYLVSLVILNGDSVYSATRI